MMNIAKIVSDFTYDPETGVVTSGRGSHGARHSRGYLVFNVDGRAVLAHRIAWVLAHGVAPSAQIDHINGNRTDNRLANLREATPAQNLGNTKIRRDNTSGFKGVSWNRACNRWQAHISQRGRSKYLGVFKSREAAHEAYLAAARDVFGEFARAA